MKKQIFTIFFLLLWCFTHIGFAQDMCIFDKNIPIKIGAHFYDYQNYHNIAYFHGGLDLVAPAGTNVYTPIAGKVEVIDYKINATLNPPSFVYTRKSFKKGTKSNTRYLEVAVTNEETKETWMFRHIDPKSIPTAIFKAVSHDVPIKAGTHIGKVAPWIQPVLPERNNYDHVHLEIVDKDGNYINPSKYIKLDKDFYPPIIKDLYIVDAKTNEALPYSLMTKKEVSKEVKFVILANDRMNSSRYLHGLYKASIKINQITPEGHKEEILNENVFQFDKLPFKGDRTQLSKVIYYDSLRLKSSRTRVRSNGNDGPRIFLINLSCGSTTKGYSDCNSFNTKNYPNGNYELEITIEDAASNKRNVTYEFEIKN